MKKLIILTMVLALLMLSVASAVCTLDILDLYNQEAADGFKISEFGVGADEKEEGFFQSRLFYGMICGLLLLAIVCLVYFTRKKETEVNEE